ncbi:MAG: hypothetical protein R3Y35_07205 [Clostridia bacterium]
MSKPLIEQRRTANINKLVKLYDIYFEKAQTDVASARFFMEFQEKLFNQYSKSEDEIAELLKGIRINEDDI